MGRGAFSKGIAVEDHALLAVSAGKVPTVSVINVQGVRENVSTVAYEELVRFGSGYTYPPLAGEAMTIVSDNAADGSTVLMRVRGLDADLLEQEELVALNGVTPVAIPGTWTRINQIANVSSTEHVGQVTVAGTNTYCVSYPDEQQSNMGIYTIPADKYGQVLAVIGSMVKTGGTETNVSGAVRFRTLDPLGVFRTAFLFGLQRTGDNSMEFSNTLPELTPGPVDLQIHVTASTTGAEVSGRMGILLQDYTTL